VKKDGYRRMIADEDVSMAYRLVDALEVDALNARSLTVY